LVTEEASRRQKKLFALWFICGGFSPECKPMRFLAVWFIVPIPAQEIEASSTVSKEKKFD
jgi:hypothetical protein